MVPYRRSYPLECPDCMLYHGLGDNHDPPIQGDETHGITATFGFFIDWHGAELGYGGFGDGKSGHQGRGTGGQDAQGSSSDSGAGSNKGSRGDNTDLSHKKVVT